VIKLPLVAPNHPSLFAQHTLRRLLPNRMPMRSDQNHSRDINSPRHSCGCYSRENSRTNDSHRYHRIRQPTASGKRTHTARARSLTPTITEIFISLLKQEITNYGALSKQHSGFYQEDRHRLSRFSSRQNCVAEGETPGHREVIRLAECKRARAIVVLVQR